MCIRFFASDYSNSQIYVGDFAKFCGPLRIYELYFEYKKTLKTVILSTQRGYPLRNLSSLGFHEP